jgi:hypothetical protein
MLTYHQRLDNSKIPSEQIIVKRRIDATDRQIDALVYELYGLTEEEIKIIEEM